MKIRCNDLQTLNNDFEKNEVTIKFRDKEKLIEFTKTLKEVFYAGPNFPDDAVSVEYITKDR